MRGPRDQLLAGSALTHDENRCIGRRHFSDEGVDLLHQGVLPYEKWELIHARSLSDGSENLPRA